MCVMFHRIHATNSHTHTIPTNIIAEMMDAIIDNDWVLDFLQSQLQVRLAQTWETSLLNAGNDSELKRKCEVAIRKHKTIVRKLPPMWQRLCNVENVRDAKVGLMLEI